MRSPFKFLDAFTLEDKAAFFGRETETEALYEMIFRTPLLLVYGASGAGKTSLIQCGLASRFDGPEWYPFFIRRQDNINESLRTSLLAALEQAPADDSVTGLVSEIFEEYLSPVYLIFDQFEELFILGSPEEQERFAQDIKALLAAELSCKVIFTIREEYLGRLYHFEQIIPSLFDFRLRVEPMTHSRIKEVLQLSFAAFNISLEPSVEDRLQEITDNLSSPKAGIQLPYLQVYLDMLWREDYDRTYGEKTWDNDQLAYPPLEFTRQEIAEFGKIDEVLKKFLQQQQVDLQYDLQLKHPGLPPEAVRQLFDAFVTADGTKRPIGFSREKDSEQIILDKNAQKLIAGIAAAPLTECLEALEQRRLLRFTEDTIELAHDSLAALIDEQRTDEQRQLNEVKMRIGAGYREWQRTGEFLSRKQLISLESYLPKVQLEEQLQQFVTDSEADADRIDREAEALRQEELNKERRLRGEAQAAKETAEQSQQLAEDNAKIATANAKRAKQRTRLALLISLIAGLMAITAGWYYFEAEEATEIANKNAELAADKTKEAEANLTLAQEAEQDTKEALSDLQKQQAATEEQRKKAENNATLAKKSADDARLALANLQQSNATVVQLILDNARKDIMSLDYDNALLKIKAADGLRALKDSVALAYLEIAFWHNEVGHRDRAVGILDSAAAVLSKASIRSALKEIPTDTTAAREALRETLKAFNPLAFETYWARYYPVMVEVTGGTFLMGCDPKIDPNCRGDETQHQATVSDFSIAKYETTWWQYHLFCVATGHEYQSPGWGRDGNNPVVHINWHDAIAYANWVSVQLGLPQAISMDSDNYQVEIRSRGYRLPTEAEWEYAAKGGAFKEQLVYSGSNALDAVGWYYRNSNGRTQAVGRLEANALGLYDMSGNVWEWCWDWKANYLENSPTDYAGPDEGSFRVLRGGSWYFNGFNSRVSTRLNYNPDNRGNYNGFRLSRAH